MHTDRMAGDYICILYVVVAKVPVRCVICIQSVKITRQSKQCGFSIYTFDNLKSKSMVRAEKMVLSGLVFARKILILIQNI